MVASHLTLLVLPFVGGVVARVHAVPLRATVDQAAREAYASAPPDVRQAMSEATFLEQLAGVHQIPRDAYGFAAWRVESFLRNVAAGDAEAAARLRSRLTGGVEGFVFTREQFAAGMFAIFPGWDAAAGRYTRGALAELGIDFPVMLDDMDVGQVLPSYLAPVYVDPAREFAADGNCWRGDRGPVFGSDLGDLLLSAMALPVVSVPAPDRDVWKDFWEELGTDLGSVLASFTSLLMVADPVLAFLAAVAAATAGIAAGIKRQEAREKRDLGKFNARDAAARQAAGGGAGGGAGSTSLWLLLVGVGLVLLGGKRR